MNYIVGVTLSIDCECLNETTYAYCVTWFPFCFYLTMDITFVCICKFPLEMCYRLALFYVTFATKWRSHFLLTASLCAIDEIHCMRLHYDTYSASFVAIRLTKYFEEHVSNSQNAYTFDIEITRFLTRGEIGQCILLRLWVLQAQRRGEIENFSNLLKE